MASILRSKAIKNVTKGNTSAYYSYVEERNGTNPVIQQLEKELNDYMGFVKKKNAGLLKPGQHAPCKVSDALFDIWNKFEPRVSRRFFYQKLMQVGEFLVQNREYSTAAWQCYDRYLNDFASINFDQIKKVEDLKVNFFLDTTDNQENVDVTFRALMGHCICMFHFTLSQDPKLQNNSSIQQLTETLRIIRLIMQLQLETDHFCWLVYNGTIYVYTIARYMMQYGLSKIVLEYLLFCCVAMESSIPLLGVKYLSWRSTLYVAVCQCYYDCKYNDDGEVFARRALSKINELYELELASVNGEAGVKAPEFREATTKIGVVLFKRLVFESRRKTRGILRPKIRLAYKDLPNQAWPRTATEKLLNEMFDCSSAQFLAVYEALNDSNRRLAMPMPAANDNEFELLDVGLELLFAAEYLVNGGGGKSAAPNEELFDFKSLVVNSSRTQIAMAVGGENGVQIMNYLKIVKLAFSYEAWEVFRRMSTKIVNHIERSAELLKELKSEIQVIHLLVAMDKYLMHVRKQKHLKIETVKANMANRTKSSNEKQSRSGPSATGRSDKHTAGSRLKMASKMSNKPGNLSQIDENKEKENEEAPESMQSPTPQDSFKDEDLLANIAYKLMLILDSNTPSQQTDLDVIVDCTLLLWRKCKEVFQKYQTGSQDNYKWVTKLENFSKWLFVLNVVHDTMCYFDVATIDPAVFAHCSLRLGLIYESLANVNSKRSTKGDTASLVDTDDKYSIARTTNTKFTMFEVNEELNEKYGVSTDVRGNLMKAKNILKKALDSIAGARASISKADKSFMCDKNYDEAGKVSSLDCSTKTSTNQKKVEKLKAMKEKPFEYRKETQSDAVSNLTADLHVELIFLYHKISMRLIEYRENKPQKENTFEKEFESLLNNCKKNKISQSLLLLSKALYLYNTTGPSRNLDEPKVLVQKAYEKLLKAEEEDKMLYDKHVRVEANEVFKGKIGPAPVVCLRTHNKIVVQPRNFQSVDGLQTCWYRIFASQLTSVNSKARISDYSFAGCGEQIPANSCEKVTISGLSSNEKYIFAVAAYDKNGQLIGNSIGESTDPILASNTLSILMNWAYLCQVCYQINEYNLALTAFDILWKHFVIQPTQPETETFISRNQVDYEVTFHQLNYNKVEKTSPILLRKFLECFFIVSEILTKQKNIYCDLIFDGKIQYFNQIERIKECEKLLVAIDLASWLNDSQIILQAIVQCYGFLAPLVYHNLAYEPVLKILTHCLLVLEETPASVFQKKPKSMFESIQHMIACTTFYLTDILKRFNKKTLSNYFNLIGRKLLGIEDSGMGETSDYIEEDGSTATKKTDEKSASKLSELKALEMYVAKTNASSKVSYFNMLTGNEDAAQIYAYIAQNTTKLTFKELIKFRKRANYFEFLVNLLQKALTEELTSDINEWCADTLEWLQKRNVSILGQQAVITKKQDGFITVVGNARKSQASELVEGGGGVVGGGGGNKPTRRRRIKKYKLLIPLDLEPSEKIKLEEKQKAAIDAIYEIFPEKYETWTRRKKLRRLFQEESAFKSQFYVTWALNLFSVLATRMRQSSPQSQANFMQRLNSFSYLDTQQFLFDKSNALLMPCDDVGELAEAKSFVKGKKSVAGKTDQQKKEHSRSPVKGLLAKNSETTFASDERSFELKDTSDLIADVISGLENFERKDEAKSTFASTEYQLDGLKVPQIPINNAEFVEMANNMFTKFKHSIVIAFRGKQWTQMQNICKLMFNCINSLIIAMPAVSANSKKVFKLSDLWKCLSPTIYIAADNLLDMLYATTPIEKMVNREMQNRFNKWFDSVSVGKTGAGLKYDATMDDCTSIDLRFVKEFIFRTVQCLAATEKWEKLVSIALKFNAMTSYKYAENLSPVAIYAQQKLIKQVEKLTGSRKQAHFERLRAELGRYPRIEDLFFLNFKIEIDPGQLKQVELGVKIDPRVHDIYKTEGKSKELISVPLDVQQSAKDLTVALENSFYPSRALMHARRLLSLFLLSQTNQSEFFGVSVVDVSGDDSEPAENSRQTTRASDMFHTNPMSFKGKSYESESDVFVRHIQADLSAVIESYEKSIQLLLAHTEKDLAVQAMHELGNIYHFAKDIDSAYHNWNEALDNLTVCKNSLIQWRKEFADVESGGVSCSKMLERCGVWGCLLGGVLTSKMAQYYLTKDLELRTECCLLSAVFFKSIFCASVPHSKYDIDYTRDDADFLTPDYLIPGLLFNNEMFRFDMRYIIAALNFVCIELVNAGHYLNTIPAISLYEYLARTQARDLTHTVFAKLIKLEALTKLNLFNEAIVLMNRLLRGERLPHFIDDKYRNIPNGPIKYTEFFWNSSKPIYDLNNLRCLESALSLKLPMHLVRLFGPHLTCRFYLVQCKLFVQIASCLPCLPNLDEFHTSQLFYFHSQYSLNPNDSLQGSKLGSTFMASTKKTNLVESFENLNLDLLDDNPDVVKIFSKSTSSISLELIKGCLLGTAKTIIAKCLKLFTEDFPRIEKYCVSANWQKELKFELNILLALISDQSQLGYISLQNLIEAMKNLAAEEPASGTESILREKKVLISSMKKNHPKAAQQVESKQSKLVKKGVYQVFDLVSKSHLNSRLWLKARLLFVQFMFNQLTDAGKAKGSDENILRDFADLKYYCEVCVQEAEKFYDNECKACFVLVDASLDIVRGVGLQNCLDKLKQCLAMFENCRQLSVDGVVNYYKAKILRADLKYALGLLDAAVEANVDEAVGELLAVEKSILESLKTNNAEAVEYHVDNRKAYFNTIYAEIKNIYNPLLHYLVHTKLRLGSCLMVQASLLENRIPLESIPIESVSTWKHALNVLGLGIELNKVICERSLNLEIELSYKFAFCIKELYMKKSVCSLSDVVDAYNYTINLIHNSTHDLQLIKNCYMELAVAFVSVFDTGIIYPDRPVGNKMRKTNSQTTKAMEAALTALCFAVKSSNAIKEKMLLPGHEVLKKMSTINVVKAPMFVASDLLGYYVLAERKKVYRDEIEEEVLTLAPEFEPKEGNKSYDEKIKQLSNESDKSITWIHMLNYQSKLQNSNSMRNLNTLKNGKNRFKYSDLYTIGQTPVFKSTFVMSARLSELNKHMRDNLEIYRDECQAPPPVLDFFKYFARKSLTQQAKTSLKSMLEFVKFYNSNLSASLNNSQLFGGEKEMEEFYSSSSVTRSFATGADWSYLQQWPANFNYANPVGISLKINDSTTLDSFVDYLFTLNWYKGLAANEESLRNDEDCLMAVIGIKETLSSNKLKFKVLSAEKVSQIHDKLAPLATIADTSLESMKLNTNESEVNVEFLNLLRTCLDLIYELFDKKKPEGQEFPFELKSTNIIDLEHMFNVNFGGYTNNESLKNFLFSLF